MYKLQLINIMLIDTIAELYKNIIQHNKGKFAH